MSNYENLTELQQFACRVIADHARSTAFAIADGILPGNEGRNYVLRKIMRRAIYQGRENLGFNEPFFYKVCDFVVGEMREAYPELEAQRGFIEKMVRLEEERFGATMTVGLKKLNELLGESIEKLSLREQIEPIQVDKMLQNATKNLSKPLEQLREATNKIGEFYGQQIREISEKLNENLNQQFGVAFKDLANLYSTYGTPRDLIRLGIEERGIKVEEDSFDKVFDEELKKLQQNSEIGKTKQADKINPLYAETFAKIGGSNFHGYDLAKVENAKVIALVKDDKQVSELTSGDEGLIILDETPFYAESGGQVGDVGTLSGSNANAKVFDTFAPVAGLVLHKSKIESGSLKVGDVVTAEIDVEKRDATRRNHTATHLLHAALREVLGTHIKQAGSVVAPNYLRFDFTHYQPLSDAEITEIEDLVNREILKNDAVNTDLMSIEDAMRTGAMALFGEKYGAKVRVLSVGGGEFSRELCGGTHVRATGDIGSFKVISDEAVASGVRRIRAITGFDAFARFREDENLISKSLQALKTQRDNLPNAIEKLQEELKKTRRENDDLKMKLATGAISGSSANGDESREINGVKVLAKIVEGLDSSAMRNLSDTLLGQMKSGVVILGRKDEAKVGIIVRVSDDLTAKVKAGNIIKELAPIVGGRGGGKPDMAEGGGNLPKKLDEAIAESFQIIEKMLL